jgi:hypothetical protein
MKEPAHPNVIYQSFKRGALIAGTSMSCGQPASAEFIGTPSPGDSRWEFDEQGSVGGSALVVGKGASLTMGTTLEIRGRLEWNGAAEERFDELVELEAFGKITDDELRELNGLQQARRNHIAPRTFGEIERELAADAAFDELTKALVKLRRIFPGDGTAGGS